MSNTINAILEFENGKKINFELYKDIAPISVDNFVALAKEGFYDGLCFHRVISGFMIQGGGFKAENGRLIHKESKKAIKGEFSSNGVNNPLKHTAGVFSMARTAASNSATSQFFICVENVPYLDGQYAAFGKTTDEQSLEVAVSISKIKTVSVAPHDDVPYAPVVIKTITILD